MNIRQKKILTLSVSIILGSAVGFYFNSIVLALIVIFFVFGVFYGLYHLNKHLKKFNFDRYMEYPTRKTYRSNVKRNYDMVNLGGTESSYNFAYKEPDVSGLNWAQPGQSLALDYKILQNFYSILDEGGTVWIPISPFTSTSEQEEIDRYYYFLDPLLINDYQPAKKKKLEFPLIYKPVVSLKMLLGQPSKKLRDLSPEEKRENALEKLEPLKNNNQKLSALKAKNTEVLKNMIEFCLVRGLNPEIVILPISSTFRSVASNRFLEEHVYGFLAEANVKGVKTIDCTKNLTFDSNALFYDSTILNEEGRKVFMQQIFQEARERKFKTNYTKI